MRRTQVALSSIFMTLVALALALTAASIVNLEASKEAVTRYVRVWEEDIARNILLKGDPQLFDKIRTQILDLSPEIVGTGTGSGIGNSGGAVSVGCFGEQVVDITLYGTPAGKLTVCRTINTLVVHAAASPIFAFLGLLGLLAQTWFWRRRFNEERAAEHFAAELDKARALGILAKQVAHDIRAPISAMKSVISVQSNEPSPEQSRQAMDLLTAATKRITSIADDLLDQGRRAEAEYTFIHQSIEIVAKEIRAQAGKGFELELLLDETANTRVQVAPVEFERVLSNLLQNALDATAKVDRPRVSLRTEVQKGETRLTIQDNGVGIPKRILAKIGDTGFSYGKQNGNGLGVSSARRMVRRLGGQIAIQSEQGQGTEVQMTFRHFQEA